MIYLTYLVCLLAISTAVADQVKTNEDVYVVNCVPCKANSSVRVINGTRNQKWEFMRGNCSKDETLHVSITKCVGCDNRRITVAIEKKHEVRRRDDDVYEPITSTHNEIITLGTYKKVDLYATLENRLDYEFILEFNYTFTCPEAATTKSPVTLENVTPATRAAARMPTTSEPHMSTYTTKAKIATTSKTSVDQATSPSSTQRSIPIASSKLPTTAETEAADKTSISTRTTVNHKRASACTVQRTLTILLGIFFAASLIALVYVINRYRRLRKTHQGEAPSTNGNEDVMGMKSNDDIAETRVNEIYNMQ